MFFCFLPSPSILVIRNEQFKTHLGLSATIQSLYREMGFRFFVRGLGKNMIAVALPVGCTIFFTDMLIQFTQDHHLLGPPHHHNDDDD